MAYLRERIFACEIAHCTSRSVVEVFDRWNGSRGYYCRKHGEAEVKRLDRAGA